jgi:ABC-type nitrate/sulfonate/bicarbonate transport system permease component
MHGKSKKNWYGLIWAAVLTAQVCLETAQLYALMVMSGLVGFVIDKGFLIIENKLTSWRFKDGFVGS